MNGIAGGQGRDPGRLIEDAVVIGVCGGFCLTAIIVIVAGAAMDLIDIAGEWF